MRPIDHSERLIGESSSFLGVMEHVSRVAPLNKSVLIVGERGTGKELVAQRLHFLSTRWEQSFIKTNCATFNENLLESELFGHETGAFTGAVKKHTGRFERADGGSLFLDELAATSIAVQEKLLRIIEYGEFERLGGSSTLKIDVRIIAASNEDLPRLADHGRFRQDLLDRLAFDVITLPPLRQRVDDIPLLAEHFALGMCQELGLEFFPGFSNGAIAQLIDHVWPGNIRELKNTVERSVYRSYPQDEPVNEIQLDPFFSPYRPARVRRTAEEKTEKTDKTDEKKPDSVPDDIPSFPINLKQITREFELKLVKKSLHQTQFNQRKAAELLGLTYDQLRGYIRKYNLLAADS